MDVLTPAQRHKNMSRIRSKGTKPEEKVMKELRRRKIYFAEHADKIAGKPDIVFRRKKVAVFIDSDFWHGHPQRFVMPKTNVEYWSLKIERNRQRDLEVNQQLTEKGWKVIRIWEYDIKKNFEDIISLILTAIDRN